jgi:hypothetical protein
MPATRARGVQLFAAAAAALLLAACGASPPMRDAPAPAKPTLTIADAKPVPAAETQTAAIAPEPRTPRAPAIDADPKRLLGLDHAALTAMLGAPEFRRKDPPAELWRYRGEGCTLSLFFYGPEKAAERDKRVLVRHVESRATGGAAVTTGDCLRVLLQARAAKKTG